MGFGKKKEKKTGPTIVKWFILGILGMVTGFGGGYLTGGMGGAMFGSVAAILGFYPALQMFGVAKNKNFLTLYVPLKDKEKYIHWPDKFGKLHTMIVQMKHEGIAYKKGSGFIDDKGTEYSWGDDPCSFAEPTSGYTYDVAAAQYTSILGKEDDIKNYDEAIKEYLGTEKYKVFQQKFRKKQKPDIYDINEEIDYLYTIEKPNNMLEKIIFWQTYSFKHYLDFLRYNYNPTRLENGIETEKIWVKQEMEGLSEPTRVMAWAKGIAIVLFVVMIVIIALSSIDMSSFIGMFTGG